MHRRKTGNGAVNGLLKKGDRQLTATGLLPLGEMK